MKKTSFTFLIFSLILSIGCNNQSSTKPSSPNEPNLPSENFSLDASFGSQGKVETSFDENWDDLFSTTLDSNGKILAAGLTINKSGIGRWALTRYSPDGSLDSGFGSGGKVATAFGNDPAGTGNFGNTAFNIIVDNENRILVAGRAIEPGSVTSRLTLVRYNSNGSVDNNFGNRGKVLGSRDTAQFTGINPGKALLIDSANRILISGVADNYILNRFKVDGSIDEDFGDQGKIVSPETGYQNSANTKISLAFSKEGKILVSALRKNEDGAYEFVARRYNSNGSIDTSFAEQGERIINVGNLRTTGVFMLQDEANRLILIGSSETETETNAILYRLNQDGSLDSSFGNNGRQSYNIGSLFSNITSAVFDTKGRILLTISSTNSLNESEVRVTRYTSDGILDSSFSSNGVLKVSNEIWARNLLIDDENRIIFSGSVFKDDVLRFTLLRFKP